jgi:hypothetical protein
MADKKVVFIAFAIEDERQRDFLKGQSLHPRAPYEFIDMSVKDAYDSDWKNKVRTRIRRSGGVITPVSKNSLKSEEFGPTQPIAPSSRAFRQSLGAVQISVTSSILCN